jgi:ABC-type branched-subunit amino acid transport system ATPase component
MIDLVDVAQHYSVRPVLHHLNLRIEEGEPVVIVGPNSMGRTQS